MGLRILLLSVFTMVYLCTRTMWLVVLLPAILWFYTQLVGRLCTFLWFEFRLLMQANSRSLIACLIERRSLCVTLPRYQLTSGLQQLNRGPANVAEKTKKLTCTCCMVS